MQKGRTDVQAEMKKVIVVFRNFSIAPKKKGNYLTRLRVDCLLCDDLSFQFFKLLPKFQRSAIENNPPLHHIRQLFNPIQAYSLCLVERHF